MPKMMGHPTNPAGSQTIQSTDGIREVVQDHMPVDHDSAVAGESSSGQLDQEDIPGTRGLVTD